MAKVCMSMGTFDKFDFLTEVTIPSILKQSFKDWKLFIVFDGPSEQNTAAYKWLNSLNDSRIDFFYTKRVLPPPPFEVGSLLWHVAGYNAVNAGLEQVKKLNPECKYIAHIDDDDAWLPNHLETTVDLLDKSNYDIVYSQARFYNSDRYCLNLGTGQFSKERLHNANFIAHSSIVYRIDADHEYLYSGDTSFPSDYRHLMSFNGDFGTTGLETVLYYQRCGVEFAKNESQRIFRGS